MATFVLVGGAWIGAWAWRETAARLRAEGHLVYPLSLTGLAERVHLARPEVGLETHITDVVNLLRYEDLSDVTLCGHSYAGSVVTGVGDRIPERLEQIVYVDAAPFADGDALAAFNTPEGKAEQERVVAEQGDGWLLPFPGIEALGEVASIAGLDDSALARLAEKATPHPWRTWTDPLRLSHPGEPAYRRAVVACDDVRTMLSYEIPAAVAMTQPPWRYEELATGHWPMLSAPAELAAILDRIAEGR